MNGTILGMLVCVSLGLLIAVAPVQADVDVIYEGSVTLSGGSFTWTDSGGTDHNVSWLTPHGALEAASVDDGFTYGGGWHGGKNTALIDWIAEYEYNGTVTPKQTWNYQLNGAHQNYFSGTTGVSNLIISDGDYIEFYYGPDQESTENATAVVRITVNPAPAVEVIWDGAVTLGDGTFTWDTTTVNWMTPHGALEAASVGDGFTYGGSWKGFKNTAVIDWIDTGAVNYTYDDSGSPKLTWNYQLNGVYQDYFSSETGVSNNPISDGDYIEFYYGPDQETTENATAVVRITVNPAAGDWDLDLVGATSTRVTKADFEGGVACGHYATWTDPETEEFWEGIPLWYLVGMVDDDPDVGPEHVNFNDSLATAGYTVKVISSDGWSAELESADIARDDGYIVANRLNGSELPVNTTSGKLCWPLHLKGPEVFGGRQVGGIVEIQLVGLPEPPEGWMLSLVGEIGDSITQAEFEDAVACHGVQYVDGEDTWEGIPLWYLCGAVDDLETTSHWTFNDSRASGSYTVTVMAADGYSRDFASSVIARNSSYIVANRLNGEPLEYTFPLKLVGSAVFGGNKVGNISEIRLVELITPSPEPGSYTLNLTGKITDVLSQAEFEAAATPSCHGVSWEDGNDTWEGVPLWFFCGWVDDRIPHGSEGFNDPLAAAGYMITVRAGDGYQKQFESAEVAHNDCGYIVADTLNGEPLSQEGDHPPWPLRLVGTEVSGGMRVGNIKEIVLSEFGEPEELPSIHIIKYVSPTNRTVVNETTVTYAWMEQNLPVIGDGATAYRFEGVAFEGDIWDQNETYPGGFKIDNTVKGTSVRALCELVGGMGTGTEIALIDSGISPYITRLGYSNIYTEALSTEQQERQGEAFLAWWDEQEGYVPGYGEGYRLFFTASEDDHVFGQWDMHECMDEEYWHYYWSEGVQYPSCAGLSIKWIDTIEIYAEPEADWDLELEGALNYTISKSYFEQGIACSMGGHAAQYTDSTSRTWSGMPLWFLCGFVDDENAHSDGAYNDSLAAAGYSITIFAGDGYNVTIESRDTIRNSNYIVANSLNGSHFPADDDNWPLRLVGTNVSGGLQVRGIAKIRLEFPEEPAPAENVITLGEGWNFISTPKRLAAGNNTAAIFDAVDTAGHSIFLYDALTGWTAMGAEDEVNPLDGIWIYSTDSIEIILEFDSYPVQVPPTKQLYAGWNAIGFSDIEPAAAADALLSVESIWTTLIGFDADAQTYESSIINGADGSHSEDREMNPTQGYWLYVTADGDLAAIGA